MKRMTGIWKHDERRLVAGLLQYFFHLLHGRHWNTAILAAIQPEHRHLQRRRDVDWKLRHQRTLLSDQTAVPGDPGLDLGIVGAIEPVKPAAPAKTIDADLVDIAIVIFGPGNIGIDVTQHLASGNLEMISLFSSAM